LLTWCVTFLKSLFINLLIAVELCSTSTRGMGTALKTRRLRHSISLKSLGNFLTIFLSMLLSMSAFASQLPLLELVMRPSVRAALEAPEGKLLLKSFGVKTAEELAETLARPEWIARSEAIRFRDALEARLNRILSEVHDVRLKRSEIDGKNRLAPETKLNYREKVLVEILSRRLLRLQRPDHLLTELSGEVPDFFVPVTGQGFASEARFFKTFEPKNTFGAGIEANTSEIGSPIMKETLAKSFRKLKEDLRYCLATEPPASQNRNFWKYMLGQLGVEEASTVLGYLSGIGTEEMRLEDLSTDMLSTALAITTKNFSLSGMRPYHVDWFRVTSVGLGRDGIDAVAYFISPADRIKKGGENPHTESEVAARFLYDAKFTALTSWREVPLYQWSQGLMCLANKSNNDSFKTVVQLGVGGVLVFDAAWSSFAYFHFRKSTLNH